MSGLFEAFVAAKKAHTEAVVRLIPAGHRCGPVQCSADEWDATEIASLKEKAARSALMPTEQDALNLMHDCYDRLRELGWNDAVYCPKDGTEFDAIEAGSTGIHRCYYDGEWPKGHWWIAEDGDLWPSRPILYRVSEEEKERWREGAKKIVAMAHEERAASGTRLRENAKRSRAKPRGPTLEEGDAQKGSV